MKTYEILDNGTLKVFSNTGVKDYCTDNKIAIHNFNIPVIIDNSVTDCSEMFKYCTGFNSEVTIPATVENCDYMFYGCCSLDKEINFPKSMRHCRAMISGTAYNHCIILPEYVENCSDMLQTCSDFNRPIVLRSMPKFSGILSWPETNFATLGISYNYNFNNIFIYCNNSVTFRDFCECFNEYDFCDLDDDSFERFSLKFNFTNLKNLSVVYPKEYHKITIADWYESEEFDDFKPCADYLKIFKILSDEYPEDAEDLLDILIKTTLTLKDHEAYLELVNYKNEAGLYRDTEESIKRRFNLDDDNSSDGETSFF